MNTAASLFLPDTPPTLGDLTAHPALGALHNSRYFTGLSMGVLAQLAAHACIRSFGAGQEIILEGRWRGAALLVVRGCISAVRRTERELILETFRSGDVLVDASQGSPANDALVAADTSVLLLLPREELWAVARSFPEVALAMASELERRLSCVKALAWSLATTDVESRLYRAIFSLARDQGETSEEGTVIKHFPTQKDLARRIGACRETVCRIVSDLARKQLLSLRGRRLTLNPGFFALARASEVG